MFPIYHYRKIKHEDSLKSLLGSMPSGNLKKMVDDATR